MSMAHVPDAADRPAQAEQIDQPKDNNVQPPAPTVADDSDPDFDDLDDVLDQFAANAPSKQPQTGPRSQPQSQPQPVPAVSGLTTESIQLPVAQPPEPDEDFLNRLAAEMAAMLPPGAGDATGAASAEDQAKLAADFEALTHKMEADGLKAEDLLKMVFGAEEASKLADATTQDIKAESSSASKPAAGGSGSTAGSTTFEDTIRRTMSRLDQSNAEASNATAQSSNKGEEDMLADMLKAFESGQGGLGDEDGLSKMFLDMMQQLTHKEMLYEPMKELNDQYPSWLVSHQPPKMPKDDFERYKRQSVIVAEIVAKFEEVGFSDDDPKCREFIWEKMQQMQGEGAPPEELVKNPFPGTDFGGIPGLGGGGGAGDGPDEGCPTQ